MRPSRLGSLFYVVLLGLCTLSAVSASFDSEERSATEHRHKGHRHHSKVSSKSANHHTKSCSAKYKKNAEHHTAQRAAKAKKSHSKGHKLSPSKGLYTVGASAKLASVSSACGGAYPISSSTVSGGPNGKQSFLNCGISGGGWEPPMVTMEMLKTELIENTGSLFSACAEYKVLFEKYGAQYNIPPIFLASIAMQESSCQAIVSGDNGGAYGLMQITQDKCGQAPGGDCSDPEYNIMMGTKTLAQGLEESGGNVLVALGAYNGWFVKMTTADATAARNSGCCDCQQNLDYLQQFLNGWIVGVDPYSHKLGAIGNLDVCGN